MIALRDVTEADIERLAILNDREAQFVNALGVVGLRALLKSAWAARTADDLSAFVLALSHETPSQGPNHGWFLAREPRFA